MVDPFLQFRETDVESGGDDAALVKSAIELNDNLSRSMVVDFLEFSNIACTVISTHAKT